MTEPYAAALEKRAEDLWRRLQDTERHAELVEAERDRYRGALRQADEELLLIADEAPEDIGTRIDSVRALLKDAVSDSPALEQNEETR